MVDVAMAQVATHLAGPTVGAGETPADAPAMPRSRGHGPSLGQDDARFLRRRSLT
jgi:hypothetical protein